MIAANKPLNAVYSNSHKLGTPALVLLLLVVETFLGMKFQCPEYYKKALVHGYVFLIVPPVILFILSLMIRPRRSPGLYPPTCCSCKYFLYVLLQAGKAPLIWFFIVLTDGRYLACILRTRYSDYYVNGQILPLIQISGLIGLAVYVSLEYCIPRIGWAKSYLSYFYRKQQEDLILREVEIIAQEKVAEKRKDFLERMMSLDLNKLSLEETCRLEDMSELLLHSKYNVLQASTAREESGEVQSDA